MFFKRGILRTNAVATVFFEKPTANTRSTRLYVVKPVN